MTTYDPRTDTHPPLPATRLAAIAASAAIERRFLRTYLAAAKAAQTPATAQPVADLAERTLAELEAIDRGTTQAFAQSVDAHIMAMTPPPTDYDLIVGLYRDHPECVLGAAPGDAFCPDTVRMALNEAAALAFARDAMRKWIREQGYDLKEYSNGHLIADQRHGTHVAGIAYGTPTARLVRLCRQIKERTAP